MEIKLGRYQHYKGDIVEVVGKALHSETMEEFVVYKHVSGKRLGEPYYPRTSPAKAGRYGASWVRPTLMFCENVIVGGKELPRFKYIG